MVKSALKGLLIAIAIVLIIFVRAYVYQSGEYRKGEAEFAKKNIRDASVHYETAIHMYTPLSGNVKKSIDRMVEIAAGYEKQQEYRWALTTYESLRSSLYAVRSFYTPYPEIIALCDGKIAELLQKTKK